MKAYTEIYLLSALPLIISMFCIVVITALCDSKWINILLQAPVWGILLWWMWVKEEDNL